MITGSTRVAAVIGDPVRHSLSPAIHNAAFRSLGLDWVFVALPVPGGMAAGAVEAMRLLDLAGLSVTMPHKHDVLPALDRLSPTAAALGAVNVVYREGGSLVGDNTDGQGFIDALLHGHGFDPAGARCAVVGAGGAARAVVAALGRAGAAGVAVLNRTAERAHATAALAGPSGRVGTEDDLVGADLVVNATPLGMEGVAPGALPFDPALLRRGQVVADLVYCPLRTPLLEAAAERGAVPVTGLDMLVHQAAAAVRLWSGQDPPLQAMSEAAVLALEGGGASLG